MVGTLVGSCRCATSQCDLDLTFDLAVESSLALPKCVHLPYLRPVSLIKKMYGLLQLIIICTFIHLCYFH